MLELFGEDIREWVGNFPALHHRMNEEHQLLDLPPLQPPKPMAKTKPKARPKTPMATKPWTDAPSRTNKVKEQNQRTRQAKAPKSKTDPKAARQAAEAAATEAAATEDRGN